MTPCWFSPKTVTVREVRRRLWTCHSTQEVRQEKWSRSWWRTLGFSSLSVKRRFHQHTALYWAFTRLMHISRNLCFYSVQFIGIKISRCYNGNKVVIQAQKQQNKHWTAQKDNQKHQENHSQDSRWQPGSFLSEDLMGHQPHFSQSWTSPSTLAVSAVSRLVQGLSPCTIAQAAAQPAQATPQPHFPQIPTGRPEPCCIYWTRCLHLFVFCSSWSWTS